MMAMALTPTCAALAAEPSYIFGVHDTGGAATIEQAGKRGWIVVTVEIGHDPNNTSGGNFTYYSSRGHGVIVRLNNGYGSAGTLPYQYQYQDFATRCAKYVAATSGADIFIIGNEVNLPREWPGNVDGNPATGEPITVARYIDCYNRCYTAIKNVRSSAQVAPSPIGTWAPNYPAQGIDYFDDYWVNMLNGIGASKIDALMLHAYTHGCDPALVTSNATMGEPYTDIYYNFRVYRNYMTRVPSTMRSKPVYITECDQNIECADPPPTPRHTWNNVNNGWVRAIYKEIDDWNKVSSNQKIRCVALFRWDDIPEGDWNFGFSNRSGVIADWLQAMQNDYRWDAYSKGSIAGYTKDAAAQPISGATVTVSPGGYTAQTAGNGTYMIADVPVGTYSVTATRVGYASATQTGKVVVADQVTPALFILSEIQSLNLSSSTSATTALAQGQSSLTVSLVVQNNGTEDLQIDQAYPVFRQGSTDVSGYYTAIPNTANGKVVPRNGGSLTLNYSVTAHADAPLGVTTIDGYARAWPNTVPNGSFEEGGTTIPPTHWWNWTNYASGSTWSYDSGSAYMGARSYKLGLASSVSGALCTANTGSGDDLLPVVSSTQYYNSMKSRTSVSTGSPEIVLVFAEYDANKTQIGSDHWLYAGQSAPWQETGTNYTTASTAAYARVWLGLRSTGSTNATLWVDDVQLRRTGALYTDSSAGTTDSWTVAKPVSTIAGAKELADSTPIKLTGKLVSAKFGNAFYIQEPDRSSAIRIAGTTSAALGAAVDVYGTLTTGSERAVNPISVLPSGQ